MAMHKLCAILSVVLFVFIFEFFTAQVYAISADMVIAQVQAGSLDGEGAATQEFVSIYNNSGHEVDISNWCLANKNNISFACFTPSTANETLHLPSYRYATISSDSFAKQLVNVPDVVYVTTNKTSGSIVAGKDNLTLINANGVVVDGVEWSTALDGGSTLQRQFVAESSNQMIDTDNMSDFQKTGSLVVPASGLTEQVVVIDVCPNVSGPQPVLPDDMELNANGDCVSHDECSNLPDIQTAIPDGFKRGADSSCVLGLLPLQITELLPNAAGSDSGNEYIEIYNPNDTDVSLSYYFLYTGSDYTHFYSFPIGSRIAAKQYLAFYNNEIKFTLVNTTSSVRLRPIDNSFIDDTPVYENPDEGMAWAVIDGAWQYTNQPTPGGANLSSLATESNDTEEASSNLVPCAPNQYRNPETNRCKLISTSTSSLLPCKEGQYRSEETNRCRSIVSDVSSLIPCAEGQERNPATNRCRSITATLGVSTLTPCKPGQERNPETNRCRNIVKSMPTADYAPEQTESKTDNSVMFWSLTGLGATAFGYGLWEWRREISGIFRK